MTQISLVGSVHEEKGLANTTELVRILERLRPEVIFLEIPTSLNEKQMREGIRETLESKSVGLYCQYNRVELVPVDLPTPELSFFRNNEQLHRRVEKVSREYCRLMDWHSEYVRSYGFPYLNSVHCDKILDDLDREIEASILQFDEPKLVEMLRSWNQMIERRDIEMMSNIRKYCMEHHFERCLFLVGASHRRSIRRKVESWGIADSQGIVWNFLESEIGNDELENT